MKDFEHKISLDTDPIFGPINKPFEKIEKDVEHGID
jgi:hypothetical protein